MAHHDQERLADLFERALTLPPADRRSYAIEACPDNPELLAELMSLLAVFDEVPNCLERLENLLRPAALAPTQASTLWPPSGHHMDVGPRLRGGLRLGHYQIQRFLGRGGMGEVWEAEDLDTGRHVALKVLPQSLGSAAQQARFLREGRLAARVTHANVVYVFGAEEVEGVPVIAMELAYGGTLKDRVAATGPLPSVSAVDAVLQMIAGLEATAAAGVLHRDFKPSNCFVDAEGRIDAAYPRQVVGGPGTCNVSRQTASVDGGLFFLHIVFVGVGGECTRQEGPHSHSLPEWPSAFVQARGAI